MRLVCIGMGLGSYDYYNLHGACMGWRLRVGRGQHAGVTASNDIILVIMPQRSGGCAKKAQGGQHTK